MPTEVGGSTTVFKQDREALNYQSPVLSKNVNSEVSHSASQVHKTSTPKSSKVYLALTESSVLDCHQSSTRQLHFNSLWPEPSLLVSGHSPANALGKNNGSKAQVASDGDPDLSTDLGLGAIPSKVPNDDPQADSSLCDYLGLVIVLQNSVSWITLCLNLNRHCLVQIHALSRNYLIPLNSAHWAVAIQHLQVMTVWALIAMDSPFSVIVLQMTIQAYLAMYGLIPQVACQAQWAITSLLIAIQFRL